MRHLKVNCAGKVKVKWDNNSSLGYSEIINSVLRIRNEISLLMQKK